MRLVIPPELREIEHHIVDALEACIVLAPAERRDTARRSRLGGDPLLPWGESWPLTHGRPLSFVGQLDFSELGAQGAALGLPSEGILGLFYDLEDHADGSRPSHRDGWEVVWCPRSDRTAEVHGPDGAQRVEPEPLVPIAALSVPSRADLALRRWTDDPLRAPWYEAYADFSERFALSQGDLPPLLGSQQQVGGHADWQERDGRVVAELASRGMTVPPSAGSPSHPPPAHVEAAVAQWRVLWQLRLLVDPATWIDRGTLYLLIRDEDLERQAFHRAWLVLL